MTNKEAATIVERIRYYMEGGECWAPTEFEAIDMAIESLNRHDVSDINVNDMIYRQMAIDALMDEFKRIPTMAIRAKHVIERMPSVQPEPCGDAVSRQVAIDTLLKWMRPICINNLGEVVESDDMVAIRNILKSLPPAQPERPKGKWIWELDERDPDRSRMLVCSICGSRRDEGGTYNFCHICGAKMINPRGEQDE